jgi:hypothetical protein
VSGAWAGSNSTDAEGWKRVNVSGLGGGRVSGGAARGDATRGSAARGGERRGTGKLDSNRATPGI